jgi:hypothetical protein
LSGKKYSFIFICYIASVATDAIIVGFRVIRNCNTGLLKVVIELVRVHQKCPIAFVATDAIVVRFRVIRNCNTGLLKVVIGLFRVHQKCPIDSRLVELATVRQLHSRVYDLVRWIK